MPSSLSFYSDIRRLSCEATLIEWRYCRSEVKIRDQFNYDDWHKIVKDIETDEDLFRANEKGYIALYVVKRRDQKKPFGFVFILVEDPKKNIVSIHGGGWDRKYKYLFPNAFLLMNRYLLDSGIKVRTSCLIGNTKAMKFIRACGFKIYRYDHGKALFYLTHELLKKSAINIRYVENTFD